MTSTRKLRARKGAALVSVIVLGIVGTLFLYGLASVILAGVRATSANKYAENLRNCAEIGMDYAVDRFNSVYPCPLDPTSNGTSQTTILPANELTAGAVNGITPNAGIPNVTVTITVTRLNNDSDWQTLQALSSIYSPQLDPSKSLPKNFGAPTESAMPLSTGGGYRIIESKATNGFLTRTIRVILKARFEGRPDGQSPLDGIPAPVLKSYFDQPSFGNQGISVLAQTGPVTVLGMGSDGNTYHQVGDPPSFNSYNLNLASNTRATIGSNVKLSGNINVTSFNPQSSDTVVSAGTGIIEGRVLANGTPDSTVVGFDTASSGNVQSRADAPNGNYDASMPRAGDNTTSIASADPNQYQAAPVVTPSSAVALTDLSDYVGTGQSPVQNNQGTFQTGALSTDSIAQGKSLPIDNALTPVRFFVDQGGNAAQAVSIDTSKLITNSLNASDLQIWYGGDRDISISLTNGKPFTGVIYAPNSKISIAGDGDFKGAVVGKLVNFDLAANRTITIDTSLKQLSTGGGGGATLNMTFKYYNGTRSMAIQGWQPITWQEYGAAMP